jgi:hypothetical protein
MIRRIGPYYHPGIEPEPSPCHSSAVPPVTGAPPREAQPDHQRHRGNWANTPEERFLPPLRAARCIRGRRQLTARSPLLRRMNGARPNMRGNLRTELK